MAEHLNPEDEYFARENREKEAAMAAELAKELAVKEKADRKALHAQRCGKCGGLMTPREFRGVEIDVCGDCNAVLLDPGELEQLAGADESGIVASLASFFSFRRNP
jgi:hypothetical protein